LVLLLLGALALYIVLERRNTLEDITSNLDMLTGMTEGSVSTIVQSLDGVEIQTFPSAIECLAYANRKVKRAKLCIDDLSWTPDRELGSGLDKKREISIEHWDLMGKVAEKLSYREVFVFTPPSWNKDIDVRRRYEKFEKRITENKPGYSCAFYEAYPQIPLPQFMIIDNQEVIFLTDTYPTYFAVKHPAIVRYFKQYYEDIWKKAVKIKVERIVYQEVVDQIRGVMAKDVQ
jgi:hypothetical protein